MDKLNKQIMIPKLIHYCWLSGDPIPENLQKCMNSWKKYLPDYEFILWDRKRFDINSTLWTKQAFEAKKYAFAADYIRLYAVYTYGGIYMDMDVEVLKSFNALLSSPYILGLETDNGIEAGIFGAEKQTPFLKDCLNYYNSRSFIQEDGAYDIRPLPSIMYDVLSRNWQIEKREGININYISNKIFAFTPDFLTAKSHQTGKIKVTNNTFSIHHFAGSWVSNGYKIRRYIYSHIKEHPFLLKIYKNTYQKIKSKF